MMYKTIQIGSEEVTLCSCASVNVCYFNVFHEDYIKMISTDEDIAASATMKLAFIMAKYGELKSRKEVNRLTEDSYCDWLDQFTTGDLIAALPEIQSFYMASSAGTVDAKKKEEELTES